jgi:hypothetical protein
VIWWRLPDDDQARRWRDALIDRLLTWLLIGVALAAALHAVGWL